MSLYWEESSRKKERLLTRDSTVVLIKYIKWVRNNKPLKMFEISIKR